MRTKTENAQSVLSREEIQRYSRHLLLPDVGMSGQMKLKRASVLLVGVGGLGSPVALYLAAAGVGRLGLVDADVLDETNLQRQVLYAAAGVGRPKTELARERLLALNPDLQVEVFQQRLTSENALTIMGDFDIVVDGTDNFPTRYLVNDACVLLKKPNVYGSIFRFEGQASVFCTPEGPCYRCMFPQPPPPGMVPGCAEAGVLGILPGNIGLIQATEVVKLIVGLGRSLVGRLLLYDALAMEYREVRLHKDPACPVCGENPEIRELIDYEHFCGLDAEEKIELPPEQEISVEALSALLGSTQDAPCLLDVREPHEADICRIPNAKLIPLAELKERAGELDPADDILVYCRSGVRSARAVVLLQEAGFTRVKNVRGGILAWAREIDPTLPTY